MSDVAIHVENLGKLYHIGQRESYRALRDTLADAVQVPFRKVGGLFNGKGAAEEKEKREHDTLFWALKNVSFEIKQGEAVGIIGRNGAGKSTLLKILSRITEPTEGYADINGRVRALLEVGTGFHPELTGRENIYLNGSILGMKRVEIKSKFDEIVAFAEVEKFIDTPVKRYSSGMYVRLAFAVAAHLEPEILIVDEVLAVGDAAFQKKCLGKMGDVTKEGRTVIFVSHNMQAIATLCNKGIFLQSGRIIHEGNAIDCVKVYNKSTRAVGGSRAYTFADSIDKRLTLSSVQLRQSETDDSGFVSHLPIEVELMIKVAESPRFQGLVVGISVINEEQINVFSSYFDDLETSMPDEAQPGQWRFVCTIPAHFMQSGSYTLRPDVGIANIVRVAGEAHQVEFSLDNICGIGSRYPLGKEWRNSVLLPYLPWHSTLQDEKYAATADGEISLLSGGLTV